jgi:acetylornithine deacetylase/succinyl-diaminopimelate desuccinylase-like protein
LKTVIIAILLGSWSLAGAQPKQAAAAARHWREAHERAILSELMGFLSIPNLGNDEGDIHRNADAVARLMEQRGIKTRMLESAGSPPVVYGEIRTPGATRTVVFYAHYDGQPVDPKEWANPPWQPVLRDRPLEDGGRVVSLPADGPVAPEWRLYARASSDDKAAIVAITAALDGLKSANVPLHSNLKFVFEGEEELGSPHLGEILEKYKDLLSGDVWLICDGPVHPSRRQQIVFGARGFATIDVTVYGARRELHSGQYANWAPNPARMLARMVASMQDDDGCVLIDHFYDGIVPLSGSERRALAEAPDVDGDLMKELWLGRTEGGGKKLVEMINLPSLNVRGISSARTSDRASNVVPATAAATMDLRLVKGMDHVRTVALVIEHIRKQGYYVVDREPDSQVRMAHPRVARVTVGSGAYNASRVSMDLPISQVLLDIAESVRGPVVKLPTIGGSVPLFMIEEILHSPAVMVPIANHDNNQHSSNENLRIQNLWDGIELLAALLAG